MRFTCDSGAAWRETGLGTLEITTPSQNAIRKSFMVLAAPLRPTKHGIVAANRRNSSERSASENSGRDAKAGNIHFVNINGRAVRRKSRGGKASRLPVRAQWRKKLWRRRKRKRRRCKSFCSQSDIAGCCSPRGGRIGKRQRKGRRFGPFLRSKQPQKCHPCGVLLGGDERRCPGAPCGGSASRSY